MISISRYSTSQILKRSVHALKLSWIVVFLLCYSLHVCAQPYSSGSGKFTVTQIKGCAPLVITINAPTCTGLPSCSVLHQVGSNKAKSLILSDTLIYNQPGTYTTQLVIGSDDKNYITITVVPNIKPDYDIYACKGDKVSLKVNDTNYDKYFIDYHDGTTLTVPSGSFAKDVHTFPAAGAQTIDVRGVNVNAADNCYNNTQTMDAEPTLNTPFINLLTVTTATQVQLNFPTPPSQLSALYKTEIAVNNNTTFQQLKNVHNVNNTPIDNLKTDDNYYCFRMAPIDYCDNTIGTYSNIICSTNFDVTPQSNVNKLTWVTNPTGITTFAIAKNPGTALSVAAPGSSIDDTDVICKTSYAYQVTSNYSNGSQSISLLKTAAAFSSTVPTVIENTTAVVTNGAGVGLQWTTDPAFTPVEYSIFKISSASSLLSKTTTPAVTDLAYTTEGNFCYTLSYRDVCDNNSPPSASVCPLKLGSSLQSDNSVNLSWSAYNGWQNGVANYTVEKYSSDGTLLQTFPINGATTTLLDNAQDLTNQVYVYVVKATANDNGLGTAVSNTITVTKNPNLFYPTAFTPDHQGPSENEVFKVFGQYVDAFEMKIFNRWGELLYSTNSLDDSWDGTFKGNPMPEGTYAFIAKITDKVGRMFNRSGSVVLLRKN